MSLIEGAIVIIQKINAVAIIMIKSTVLVEYMDGVRNRYRSVNIAFSLECLREGRALHDNVYSIKSSVGK